MKICPDMTEYQIVKAVTYGNGDFQRAILNECIKERCVAYENGMCRKYMTKAYVSEKEVNE